MEASKSPEEPNNGVPNLSAANAKILKERKKSAKEKFRKKLAVDVDSHFQKTKKKSERRDFDIYTPIKPVVKKETEATATTRQAIRESTLWFKRSTASRTKVLELR